MNSEEMCIWPGCEMSFITGARHLSDGPHFLCVEHTKEFKEVMAFSHIASASAVIIVFQQLAAIKDELDL